MTFQARAVRKYIAAVLAATLILLSPGLPCYQALAQFHETSGIPGSEKTFVPSVGVRRGSIRLGAPLESVGNDVNSQNLINADLPHSSDLIDESGALMRDFRLGDPAAENVSAHKTFSSPSPTSEKPAAEFHRNPEADLLDHPDKVSMPSKEIERLPLDETKDSGARMMDPILRTRSGELSEASDSSAVSTGQNVFRKLAGRMGLGKSSVRGGAADQRMTVPPPQFAPTAQPGDRPEMLSMRSRTRKLLWSLATVAISASVTVGLQYYLVFLLPGVFGMLPFAGAAAWGMGSLAVGHGVNLAFPAMWSVSSGAILMLSGLYGRYLLSTRNSHRLWGVKLIADMALGVFLGGAVLSVPAFIGGVHLLGAFHGSVHAAASGAAGFKFLAAFTGLSAALFGLTKAKILDRDNFVAFNLMFGVVILLAMTPPLFGGWVSVQTLAINQAMGGHAQIFAAGLMAMAAVAAMTTIQFFLRILVNSAESGRAFSVPGGMGQVLRFPDMNWVMMGVVFALASGFLSPSGLITNGVFFAWNAFKDKPLPDRFKKWLGDQSVFNVLYMGSLAVVGLNAALSGVFGIGLLGALAGPLGFLTLAFSVERAAKWTEGGLMAFLPQGDPDPSSVSTSPAPDGPRPDSGSKWHRTNYWIRTGILLATMALILSALTWPFGVRSVAVDLGLAALMAFIPFWFSKQLVTALTNSKPTDKEHEPALFEIAQWITDRVNSTWRAGKTPIPLPTLLLSDQPVENAFATGRSPWNAAIGFTQPIRDANLDPESRRMKAIWVTQMVDRMVRQAATEDEKRDARYVYEVWHWALESSFPGVSAGADTQAVLQALQAATPEQLKAFGMRDLKGVASHEWSHVMNRDMLTNSMVATIQSAVTFLTYGFLWSVVSVPKYAWGHVKFVWERAKRVLRGKPEIVEDRRREPSGLKPQVLEPVTGVAVAAASVLVIKAMTAMWSVFVSNVLLMTATRAREAAADQSGAELSGDPEALAAGLLSLIARPEKPNVSAWTKLKLTFLSHIFTVSPLDQIYGEADSSGLRRVRPPAGAEFDYMFGLFMSHPDTIWRIIQLRHMAYQNRMRGARRDNAPPGFLSKSPPGELSRSVARVGEFFSGIWNGLLRLVRVFPDKTRNRQFWVYALGDALVQFGATGNSLATTNLMSNNGAAPGRAGLASGISDGAKAVSSLATASMPDRYPAGRVAAWSLLIRAVSMAFVAQLIVGFNPATAVFTFLFMWAVFINNFARSTGSNAGSVGLANIINQDPENANKANAVCDIVDNVVGVVAPLAFSVLIAFLHLHVAEMIGYQLIFGIASSALLLSGIGYMLFLKFPQDPMFEVRRGLYRLLNPGPDLEKKSLPGKAVASVVWFLGRVAKYVVNMGHPRDEIYGVYQEEKDGRVILRVEAPAKFTGAGRVPEQFQGYPVEIQPRRGVVKLVQMSRFMRRAVLFTTLESMIWGAFGSVVMPVYLHDAFGAARAGTLLGVFESVGTLGMGVSSLYFVFGGDRTQSDLDARLAAFRKKLAEFHPELSSEQLDSARNAVERAVGRVLENDRLRAKTLKSAMGGGSVLRLQGIGPVGESNAEEFKQRVLQESLLALKREAFHGEIDPAEAEALFERTGLAESLGAWAGRHFEALRKDAAKTAKTGLTRLERQVRWTHFASAAGTLCYIGMLLLRGLPIGLGSVFVAGILQGFAGIVFASLLYRVMRARYPDNTGRVLGFFSFYQLLWSVVGAVVIGQLLNGAFIPARYGMFAVYALLVATAISNIWEPFAILPLDPEDGGLDASRPAGAAPRSESINPKNLLKL